MMIQTSDEHPVSESEEMYLTTIAHLLEEGVEYPIPISDLAQELAIQPVSANQMVHKLAAEGMVTYEPYKGVELTTEGSQAARDALRRRRLWEVFLVEHLDLSPGEAEALACRIEHVTPSKVVDRLDDFLGRPAQSPQGLAIPKAASIATRFGKQPLAEVPMGQARAIQEINAEGNVRAFLEGAGLWPGVIICPADVLESGGMIVQYGNKEIKLPAEVVDAIVVERR